MDFIDVKYIQLISSRLQKFKKIKPNLYNCRCPICGDSQKDKKKARGYFYRIKNNTNYKCHNCGLNISFNNFLKQFDEPTHKEYIFEKFKGNHTGKNYPVEQPKDIFKRVESSKPTFKKKVKIDLPNAFDVNISKEYLHNRGIFDGNFYYAENFQVFVNTLKPGSFTNTKYGEKRIVIPLVRNDKLIGVQGRALSSNPVKYLTIMLEEDELKVYGLDTIDKENPIYVTEGPFDSTFLSNAIAMCGSDVDLSTIDYQFIYVYDNEPRNKQIVDRISKQIDSGERIVIWPSNIKEKDINDMILCGHNVKEVVEKNTYQGLEAKLKFTNWKRV